MANSFTCPHTDYYYYCYSDLKEQQNECLIVLREQPQVCYPGLDT